MLLGNRHSELVSEPEFKRTFLLENNEVVYKNNTTKTDYKQSDVGTPDYSDLFLDKIKIIAGKANAKPINFNWLKSSLKIK